jgi:hypothetical protein
MRMATAAARRCVWHLHTCSTVTRSIAARPEQLLAQTEAAALSLNLTSFVQEHGAAPAG